MGSGAGSNFVNEYLLTFVGPNSGSVASPTTAYGAIGVNDSGGYSTEGRAFSKASFQLVQVGSTALSGIAVTLYGTLDPAASQTWWNALQGKVPPGPPAGPINGYTDQTGYVPGLPPFSWQPLPGPSDQSGAGSVGNPLTPSVPFFTSSLPVVAVRAVVTSTASPAGVFHVAVLWIP